MAGWFSRFTQGTKRSIAWVTRPWKVEHPPTRAIPRTGDQRYVPFARQGSTLNSPDRIQMAARVDNVSYTDYDRARWYPVVWDAIQATAIPASRANIHFSCDDSSAAELASQILGPLLPDLIRQTMIGSKSFGWHSFSPRITPKFDVVVSANEGAKGDAGGSTGKTERYYPYVWAVKRFHHFDPRDCRILIDTLTGDFRGIRQMVLAEQQDVHFPQAFIYTNHKEYDQNHGVPISKGAIPFIDLALDLYESMGDYGRYLANGKIIAKYPLGRTILSENQTPVENADIALEWAESLMSRSIGAVPSNTHDDGVAKWGLEVVSPPASTPGYTDMISLVDQKIRLATGVNEAASADTVKVGGLGDQGADEKITLHLQNVESDLDGIMIVINEFVDWWRIWNFGVDSPPIRAYAEPIDTNVTKTILATLVTLLSSGEPLTDADGNLIYLDYSKILTDKGFPTISVSGKRLAQRLMQTAQQRLAAGQQGGSGGQDGQSDGGEGGGKDADALVNKFSPKPDLSERRRAAIVALREAVVTLDTAAPIKTLLNDLLDKIALVEDDKGHEHGSDGKFVSKGEGGEAQQKSESPKQKAENSKQTGTTETQADYKPDGVHVRPGGFLERNKVGEPVSKPIGSLHADFDRLPHLDQEHYDRLNSHYKAAMKVDTALEVKTGPEQKGEKLERVTDADTPEIMRLRKAQAQFREDFKKATGLDDTSHVATPEREALRNSIARDLFGKGAAKQEKKAYLISGPPGSGKSSAIKSLGLLDPEKFGGMEIDSDYAKSLLPEFNAGRSADLVHEEAADIAERVLQHAISGGHNIVHPIVGKSVEGLERNIKKLKEAGYQVVVHNIEMETERSVESVAARFHRNGRFVPPEYAQSVDHKPSRAHSMVAEAMKDYPGVSFTQQHADELRKK